MFDSFSKALHKEGPVGQPSQGVMKRVMQQLLLSLLALSDVGLSSGYAGCFPAIISHGYASSEHPAVMTVFMYDTILAFESISRLGQKCTQPRLGMRTVVGVYA